MKARQLVDTGGAEVLILRDVPDPVPGTGEVLIRVDAAGINCSGIIWRRGEYDVETPLPFIPSAEVAGTVVAVGPDANGFRYALLSRQRRHRAAMRSSSSPLVATTFPIPDGISPIEVISFMTQGLSAALALRKSGPLARVLVEAAAGGVSSFALRLAKLYGAGMVIAAASSPEKCAIAEACGPGSKVDP